MTPEYFLTEVYAPSKPAAVRELFRGVAQNDRRPPYPLEVRAAKAKALSDAGVPIDEEIDAEGAFPMPTIQRRLFYGYERWPSWAQGSNVDPVSGARDYDNPKFAFKVSLNLADYPKNTEPDIVDVQYVGEPANAKEGRWNAQNNPEKAINPQTGDVFVRGDEIYEKNHTFTLDGPAVDGSYYWLIEQ